MVKRNVSIIQWVIFCFSVVNVTYLEPRPWPEGSYELGSVLLPVLLSGSFLGIGSLVYSETLYGVRGPYGDVRDKARPFCKILPAKMTKNYQKWSKIEFLDFLGKSIHYFRQEMVENESTYDPLVFCENCICGKNLVFKLWPKILLANHIPISSIVNISLMDWHLTLIFCM